MNYPHKQQEETHYLKSTLAFLEKTIENEYDSLAERKHDMLTSRREMWENSAHASHDFDKLTEMNQYLTEVINSTAQYSEKHRLLTRLEKLMDTPYFGRFDFLEVGTDQIEKIYIGLSNIINRETGDIWVYDWRAPISSIFYRYELGNAQYNAPMGAIKGQVSLKRQYKIRYGSLVYFFDCSIAINDEMLQEILSSNASPKMRSIVESIQKEQDTIIRDEVNELLIVQGTAGSGKTSVALHRIAFLLYQGLSVRLTAQNIVIVSPNQIFSGYISDVLPGLGEENVNQFTFDDFSRQQLAGRYTMESRNQQLERLVLSDSAISLKQHGAAAFKGSDCFLKLLGRLLAHYERHMVSFEDIYYDGKVLLTRQQLRTAFLNSRKTLPMTGRMKSLELMIFDKIHTYRKARLHKIQKFLTTMDGHELDAKSFGRLLAIKEARTFTRRLRKTTDIDFFKLYEMLFSQAGLLRKLSKGLALPDDLESIVSETRCYLREKQLRFEDCAPLLYLKFTLEGWDQFPDIRHVVIDEAQDYSLLQYVVFKQLFRYASFTILGDVHQTMSPYAEGALYERIAHIFEKQRSAKITMKKSYRSTYEITEYANKIPDTPLLIDTADRHGKEPHVEEFRDEAALEQAILQTASMYLDQGYETVAVLCKTAAEAQRFHARLVNCSGMKLFCSGVEEMQKGILILPVYLSKGLEFDAVIIANANAANYFDAMDRRLLYIACTRALHRLSLFHTGEKSPFI